jgi:hypothetical protein
VSNTLYIYRAKVQFPDDEPGKLYHVLMVSDDYESFWWTEDQPLPSDDGELLKFVAERLETKCQPMLNHFDYENEDGDRSDFAIDGDYLDYEEVEALLKQHGVRTSVKEAFQKKLAFP